jgi:predicted phosphodiesterase
MRIGVFSDVHANLEALEAVLKDSRAQGCTLLFCCGDVVGYGGCPNECCRILRERNIETVKGNHDEAVAIDFPLPPVYFNPAAAASILWTREYTTVSNREWLDQLPMMLVKEDLGLTICHASPINPQNWEYLTLPAKAASVLAVQKTPICFIGHSHQPRVFWTEQQESAVRVLPPCPVHLEPGERYLINVGSVGQPRDEDCRASYFIYDREDELVFPRRVPYAVEGAQKRIRDAGLPDRLADRLAVGR